jgi:uncharacterized protein (TIGR03083 family)
MKELIADGRRRLAETLGGLDDTQWRAPSLCEKWTVAHVVAHLTMPYRITGQEFADGMRAAGGRFEEFSDGVAERDSRLPHEQLVAALRDNADHPWSPPGGGLAGALSHDTIHGLDATWPLGVDHPIADEALVTVLDLAAGTGGRSVFGVDVTGVRLRATDLDWSAGAGPLVEGRGRDLLLLVAGRRLPADRFGGPGAERLTGAAR